MTTDHLQLAVALDGAGWHPAAWRLPDARPAELLEAGYWTDLLAEAERGLLDFVTIDDGLLLQSSDRHGPDGRTDQVRGRLDAVLIAARIAPTTSRVGVVPVVTTVHTEPFHISKAIATVDLVSAGRAGVQIRVGGYGGETSLFGRRDIPELRLPLSEDPATVAAVTERFDEAADFVEVIRRLWDSWQDDAVIKDAATGRYIDRERLHYIDFQGRWFNVKGPSITPRPPQGQPLVTVLAHGTIPYRLAARQADVVFTTPHDAGSAAAIRAEVTTESQSIGRPNSPLLYADLVVLLDADRAAAQARKAELDELDGGPLKSDARIVVGTPDDLVEELAALHSAGYDGVRLRPAALPYDLNQIVDRVVPELQRRGLFRTAYESSTLRGHLGLDRPVNRYEVA